MFDFYDLLGINRPCVKLKRIEMMNKNYIVSSGGNLLICGIFAIGVVTHAANQEISDTTPPQLVDFSVTPTNIDVTASEQSVDVSLGYTDDLSGFSEASVIFSSPTGVQTREEFLFVEADPLDGSIQTNISFPQFIENGTWSVSSLTLKDSVGNSVTFDTNTLADLGFQTAIEVISNPDLDPPVINSISYSTQSIDVSDGPQAVVIDLEISDEPAGVVLNNSFVLEINSPSFNQTKYVSGSEFSLISGDTQQGVWQATAIFPQYSEVGEWTVGLWYSDSIKDSAGNQLQPFDAFAGLDNTIDITSSTSDAIPPQLAGFDFTPKAINTSTGDVNVNVVMQLQDDLSGMSFEPDTPNSTFVLGTSFRSPSGGQSARQSSFGGITLTDGDELDGTWEGLIQMRQFSEDGTWKIDSVRVKDKTNNVTTLNATNLEALGFPTELVVIRPSLDSDGTVDGNGGTITDGTFGERAKLTIPADALSDETSISIDVFQDPIDVPTPAGFSADGTRFVNIDFTPEPNFPLGPPGMTVVLPLIDARIPGSPLSLFKIDTNTATLVPSIGVDGSQVVGVVDAGGLSATFTGVAGFSTVIGLAEIIVGDLNGDQCVDRADYSVLLGLVRGSEPVSLDYDLNGDGAVNIADIRKLITLFTNPRGAACNPSVAQ